MDGSSRKSAILVAGMHRSGTSAVSRLLSLLGCDLPRTLCGTGPDNPRGFWESVEIRDLNDAILESAGSAWDDWEVFDPRWYESPVVDGYRDRTRTVLVEEFGDSRLFVLKDPRICRLLPFWLDALGRFGAEPFVVVPVRNPLDVAMSLETRNGIDRSIGHLLWLRHLLDVEAATRDLQRAYLRYERLISEPHTIADELSERLGVTWPCRSTGSSIEIDDFLSPALRHHRTGDAAFLANARLSSWIRDSFEIFDRWTASRPEETDRTVLDRIRTAFDEASPAFGRPVAVSMKRTIELGETQHALGAAQEKLADEERRAERLVTDLNAAREETAAASRAMAEHRDRVAVRTEELGERDRKIEELSAELDAACLQADRLDRQLQEIRTSNAWRITAPLRHTGIRVKLLIRVMKFLLRVLRTPRGGKSVLQRTVTVIRTEGVGGLAKRLRRVAEYDAPSADASVRGVILQTEFSVPDATSQPDIFVLSIIDWNFRFQRSQHLAIEFAKSGRRVFYFEMMLEAGERSIVKVRENLFRVRLSSKEIGYIQPYFGQATDRQKAAWIEELCRVCESVHATAFKQVVIQHPYWWQFARLLPPEFQLVHDCMDDVSGFSNTDDFVLEMESDMAGDCDSLVVSSAALFDKHHAVRRPRLIRNAVHIEHFSPEEAGELEVFRQNHASFRLQPMPAPASGGEAIKVGYVGAIAEWFDAELVRRVALDEPHCQFHLCGDVTSTNVATTLSRLDNVRTYGEINYLDVPAFLAQMDVLIIPFRIIPIIEACDPVKFYEYSAMGKPTVATLLPELERASELVFFASTPDEFARQIRNAYDKRLNRDFVAALRDYASRNTWHQRGIEFLQAVGDLPLISVIILSYGDAELTMAAIRSLFDRGAAYPNLEVLVVDNGSPRAELGKIRECAGRYRDIRIVENAVNLGFAKGNNVGLTQARGEYVMLLNNDTYVAPGAIYGMARHLARHPEIGAVGPLTNNIGNEARLVVNYADMEEMKRMARAVTWGYRNRHFPVDVLAYFAVMFRRRDLEIFGLLPEDYGIGMFEDDDHCRIIHSTGYRTVVAEDAFVHHHLSASFSGWDSDEKQALFDRNKAIFERKWGPWKAHEYRAARPERIL